MEQAAIDAFRAAASDPEAWRQKARLVRRSADALWNSYTDLFTKIEPGDRERAQEMLGSWLERMNTAQFLYGLAVETALKAKLIALDAANISFAEVRDGRGQVIDLRISKIGVDLGADGHDLRRLAEAAGVGPGCPGCVFAIESDRTAITEILAYLTDCVRWSGRYPAPKRMSEGYKPSNPIPARVLGHYMRDWLDPFLDELLAAADQGND